MGDFASPYPMLRLLQGDVGTGKTLVAALAALAINEQKAWTHDSNGNKKAVHWQCAICVPRVQLAKQFRDDLEQEIFKQLPERKRPIIEFIGESVPKGTVYDLQRRAQEGAIDIVVGTNAIMHLRGCFQSLGLVIVDEEHKFGANYKQMFHKLSYYLDDDGNMMDAAATAPHYLAMSATPIPRSLALANFGVMSISRMDGLPTGKGVVTYARELSEETKSEALQRVNDALKQNNQAYIVCSRVESRNEAQSNMSVERAVRLLSSILGREMT